MHPTTPLKKRYASPSRARSYRFYLLLGLCLTPLHLSAQTASKSSNCWKIGEHAYLFGSLHAGTRKRQPPRVAVDAFNESDILVVEIDIIKEQEAQWRAQQLRIAPFILANVLLSLLFYYKAPFKKKKEGEAPDCSAHTRKAKSLPRYVYALLPQGIMLLLSGLALIALCLNTAFTVDKERRDLFQNAINNVQVLPWYKKFLLSYAYLGIKSDREMCNMILKESFSAVVGSPRRGMERFFITRARAMGKKIVALETLEEQERVFKKMHVKKTFLKDFLKTIPDQVNSLQELVQAWEEGDLVLMAQYIEFEKKQMEWNYEEDVYVKRNARMARKLSDLVTQDKKFFALIGTAHLAKEHGLIPLLEKKYRIEQLNHTS